MRSSPAGNLPRPPPRVDRVVAAMRAPRLAAATVLAFLWLGVSILPISTASVIAAVACSLAVLAAELSYERRHRDAGTTARRDSLDAALRARRSGLSAGQHAQLATIEEDGRDAVGRLANATPGISPRAAIEALPWIISLGVPGSGRSALLASSGVRFSYVTPNEGPRGKRSLRWWISERGVVLDTSGEHVASDAGHAEWLTTLRAASTLRAGQSLHGIVVTLAAETISAGPPEALDGWANRIRDRIDEVQLLLGFDLPVHLVITRCDLLHGFREFFADIPDAERQQVWGFTLPLSNAPTPAVERIGAELAALLTALSQRQLRRANARDQLEIRQRSFQFPLWFAALRPSLLRFVATLFARRDGVEPPLARGLWFTSAAEAHTVIPRVPQQGSGFFVHDLFVSHVFPDGALATASKGELRRRRDERALLATPLFAGAALAMALSLYAWRANSVALSEFSDAMNAAAAARPPMRLDLLDNLRARTESLRELNERGAPRWMRLGFFVGEAVTPQASTVFALLTFRDVVRPELDASRRALEQSVRARHVDPPARPATAAHLRLYLLLTTPRASGEPDPRDEAEAAWLASEIARRWSVTRSMNDAGSIALVLNATRLYAAILAGDPRLGTPRDLRLVEQTRALLGAAAP